MKAYGYEYKLYFCLTGGQGSAGLFSCFSPFIWCSERHLIDSGIMNHVHTHINHLIRHGFLTAKSKRGFLHLLSSSGIILRQNPGQSTTGR